VTSPPSAELTTTVERAIVQRDGASFGRGLRTFAKFMVPLSIVNALLKYGQSEVALRFRQRLTAHIMDR
jgi:ABC transporter transmembrane region 2